MSKRAEIELKLAKAIAHALRKDLKDLGGASLLVSGGSTPIGLFETLQSQELDWENVSISLVDERVLPNDHPDLNATLVKNHLLTGRVAAATFIPLVIHPDDVETNLKEIRFLINHLSRPFSAVVLGMGNDGHTASLFPKSPQLADAMRLDQTEDVLVIDPVTAPYTRITFTRKTLLNTNKLFLHCYGIDKQTILNKAKQLTHFEPYPIAGFLNNDIIEPELFWAE